MSRGRRNPVLGPIRRWTLYSPRRLIAIVACTIGLVIAISIATTPPPHAKHIASQPETATSADAATTTAATTTAATPPAPATPVTSTPTALLVPTTTTDAPPVAGPTAATPTSPHLTAVTAPPEAASDETVPSATLSPTTTATPVPPAPAGPALPPATAPGLDDPLLSDPN